VENEKDYSDKKKISERAEDNEGGIKRGVRRKREWYGERVIREINTRRTKE